MLWRSVGNRLKDFQGSKNFPKTGYLTKIKKMLNNQENGKKCDFHFAWRPRQRNTVYQIPFFIIGCWRWHYIRSIILLWFFQDSPDKGNIRTLCTNIIDSILVDIRTAPNRENSFMNGDHGVYVVAALVFAEVDRMEDAVKALKEFARVTVGLETLALPGSSADECFTGRSGYLIGFLELWKRFPDHPVRSEWNIERTRKLISIRLYLKCRLSI